MASKTRKPDQNYYSQEDKLRPENGETKMAQSPQIALAPTPTATDSHSTGSQVLGSTLIAPYKMSRLVVHPPEYNNQKLPVQLMFEPNQPETVGISLKEIEQDDTTALVYHFQNFSAQGCRVTVLAVN